MGDAELLRELAAAARRHGVKVTEGDLAVVLPVHRENREGLERLRRILDEAGEPAVVFVSSSPRAKT